MKDPLPLRMMNWMFDYGICLPLTLTRDNRNRVVRVFGLIAFFLWFFPAGFVLIIPILLSAVAYIFQQTWSHPE